MHRIKYKYISMSIAATSQSFDFFCKCSEMDNTYNISKVGVREDSTPKSQIPNILNVFDMLSLEYFLNNVKTSPYLIQEH